MSQKSLNNHQRCRARDRAIMDALADYKILNTNQLAMLFFPSVKMARKRMAVLAQKGRVKRGREYIDQPNFYYLGKRPGDICETINMNWVRIWLQRNLNWGDQLTEWAYLSASAAVATFYNRLNGNSRRTIIDFAESEIDISKWKCIMEDNGREFSLEKGCLVEKQSSGISAVVISDHKDRIRNKMRDWGIRFHVYSLEEVKGGVKIG